MLVDTNAMSSAIDDGLLAAILSVGLQFGVLSKRDTIAWADQEIEQRSNVPSWLIDLSMSSSEEMRHKNVVDLLTGVGGVVDRNSICTGIYSLLPDISSSTYNECDAIAKQLYKIVRSIYKGDFSCPRLTEMMDIYERFEGWAMFTLTHEEVVKMFREFIELRRDDAVRSRLQPVRFISKTDVQMP